jgi:hypothetical protein
MGYGLYNKFYNKTNIFKLYGKHSRSKRNPKSTDARL